MGHSFAKNSSRPWGCSIDLAEQIPYGLDILVRRIYDLSFLWAINDGEIKLGRKVGIVSAEGRGVQFQTAWWGAGITERVSEIRRRCGCEPTGIWESSLEDARKQRS